MQASKLNQVVPFSYDHFFKIPLFAINQADIHIEKIKELGILLYRDGKKLIMSDDYVSYFVLRKAGYLKVKAIILAKSLPKDFKIIRKGGVELLPGLMRINNTNYDQLSIELKDQIFQNYIDRLNTLNNLKNILDSKYVVLTEDVNILHLKVLLQSNGFSIDETEIYSYKSSTNLNNLDLIVNTFRNINTKIKIIVHRDRDYLVDKEIEKIRARIKESGAEPFFTKGTDIESYFINSMHIKALYPDLNIKIIEKHIDSATHETSQESIENILKQEHGEKYKTKHSRLNEFVNLIYNDNRERYRHGKKTLGILKTLLQKELKQNINLFRTSEYLQDEELKLLL